MVVIYLSNQKQKEKKVNTFFSFWLLFESVSIQAALKYVDPLL